MDTDYFEQYLIKDLFKELFRNMTQNRELRTFQENRNIEELIEDIKLEYDNDFRNTINIYTTAPSLGISKDFMGKLKDQFRDQEIDGIIHIMPAKSARKNLEDVVNILKNSDKNNLLDYETLNLEEDKGEAVIYSICENKEDFFEKNKNIPFSFRWMCDNIGWNLKVKHSEDRRELATHSRTTQIQNNNSLSTKKEIREYEQEFVQLLGMGGCGEVGRSAFRFKFPKGINLLIDYGVSFSRNEEKQYPLSELIDIEKLNSVIITHAHANHLSALPKLFEQGYKGKVYMQKFNKDIIPIMLHDYHKVFSMQNESFIPYEKESIDRVLKNIEYVDYEQEIEIEPGITAKLLNAGHIIGSSMVEIRYKDFNILYTGDFNKQNTNMLKAAEIGSQHTTIISESTYGNFNDSMTFSELKKSLISEVNETISKDGTVIIPAFALGRSQEVIYTLLEQEPNYDIYIDGMIKKINPIVQNILDNEKSDVLMNPGKNLLKNKRLKIVNSKERDQLTKNKDPKVIVTTSGMCMGLAENYIKNTIEDEKNKIILVGYQAYGTLGRQLLQISRTSNVKFSDNSQKQMYAKIVKNPLSAHAQAHDLRGILFREPKQIVLVHGEPKV